MEKRWEEFKATLSDERSMSKKEFCELLESDVKETEFKIILEISKIVQRGYRNGKYQED